MKAVSKILFVAILFSLIGISEADAQKWKYYRHEVSFQTGVTNFLGELGGSDELDPKFWHTDYDFRANRYSFNLGYGFKLTEKMNLKTNLIYARVGGSDKYTENIYRVVRNLSFRSTLYEASTTLEYYLLREQTGASYKLEGIKGTFLSNLSAYLYAGIGGLYFIPQAEYNGKYVDLAPLNTEGQGLPDKDGNIIPDYEQYTITIPIGAGVKYHFSKQISVGIEYGSRHTFSDYIDDVSTNYYDNTALRAAYGDVSADLADPNILYENPDFAGPGNLSWTSKDQQRGSPSSKDYYLYTQVGFYYKFLKGKSIKPRF